MIIRSQSVITKAAVARGLHGVVIVPLRKLFIYLPLLIIFACLYKLRKVIPPRSNPLKRLVRLRNVFETYYCSPVNGSNFSFFLFHEER